MHYSSEMQCSTYNRQQKSKQAYVSNLSVKYNRLKLLNLIVIIVVTGAYICNLYV